MARRGTRPRTRHNRRRPAGKIGRCSGIWGRQFDAWPSSASAIQPSSALRFGSAMGLSELTKSGSLFFDVRRRSESGSGANGPTHATVPWNCQDQLPEIPQWTVLGIPVDENDTDTPRVTMTARPVPIGGISLALVFFVPRTDHIKPLGFLGLLDSWRRWRRGQPERVGLIAETSRLKGVRTCMSILIAACPTAPGPVYLVRQKRGFFPKRVEQSR